MGVYNGSMTFESRIERRVAGRIIPGSWHDVPEGKNSNNYKEWRRLIISRTLRPINIEVITAVDPLVGEKLQIKAEWGYPNKGKANSHSHITRTVEQGDTDGVSVRIDHPRRMLYFRSKESK